MCKWEARAVFNFFPTIKRSVNNLLGDGDDYAINPRVDVELLARQSGLDIRYVPKEEIWEKYPNAHAYLDDENKIIYVSKDDNPGKQRFSIAHELFHFIFVLTNEDGNALSLVARMGNTWKEKNAGSDEAVGEDIADFYAANLLVPTERFVLWDEKPDSEIASAFGVEEECIERRKKEIDYELDCLVPKYPLSDEDADGQASIAAGERHNAGGHNTHATGKD